MSIITLNTRSLPDSAVTTAKIAADAVTDAKIADDVVGTEHLTANEVDTTALGADAVTAAQIADDAISEEHLDATVITGMTELAAEPADTDEFLISDAGTLKRIDYSHIKGGGITGADQWRINGDVQYGTGNQVIDSQWERVDSPTDYGVIGSAMTESSGIFTFPTTGIWLIQHQQSVFRSNGEIQRHDCRILTTTNNSTYVLASQAHVQTDDTNYRTSGFMSFIFDVTDTSTHKVQFGYADASNNNPTLVGSSNEHFTASFFIRLADT
jgi:hypothetical protein